MNAAADANQVQREVAIDVDGHTIRGTLVTPADATGVVLFAHGSGSSRHSPRNRYVAGVLQQAGLATLMLEESEAEDRAYVLDIRLLAARLEAASDWVTHQAGLGALRQGYFGASTGAAAALLAAAARPERIAAVVSRGGRPDLARESVGEAKAATLLIVGGADEIVLERNREAFDRLSCVCQLDIVPGATHLFGEPGALEEVGRLAVAWFGQHLGPTSA